MNRGLSGIPIYSTKHHYEMFLELLAETQQRFGAEIHAYCLLRNHYHLLLQTPRGNLSRIMRHIDGVYTQRFNRSKKRDGPLFRGRYKAILIEVDNYLLQVSRYIHLNPVSAKITKQAEDYQWSSYKDYISKHKTHAWLNIEAILEQIGSSRAPEKYRNYITQGIDDEIRRFYSTKYQSSILGGKEFKSLRLEQLNNKTVLTSRPDIRRTQEIPTIGTIVKLIAQYVGVSITNLKQNKRGTGNLPRLLSILICSHQYGHKIIDIAKAYDITPSAASVLIGRISSRLQKDKALKKKYVDIINYVSLQYREL